MISTVGWLHCFWVYRQNIVVEGHGGAQQLTSWQLWEDKSNRRGPEPRYNLQKHAPATHFLHLPIVYSNLESMTPNSDEVRALMTQ
jgi:hypothetical protein